MATQLTDDAEKVARKNWDIGSNLDVYSRSKSKWYRGIISKTNGPYVTVQYRIESGEVGEKDVHRTDEIIRPVEEQLQDPEVAYYKQKIHEIFKSHDAQYMEYAEQMFEQDQVRGKEKEFYENVCGKYDVTPEPYDPMAEPLNLKKVQLELQKTQAELARAKNSNITLQKQLGSSSSGPPGFESKRLPPTSGAGGPELETLRSQNEELKHLNESIKSMAYADSLTQKLNKRAFDRDLIAANLGPFIKGLTTIVVAKFDQVRSLLGRHHANEVLYEIAQQLDAAVEPVSKRFTNKVQIYRVSGDEFAVLVRFTADDVKTAEASFNELLQSIGKVSVYVTKKDDSYQVSASVTDQAPEVVCGVYVGGHLANPVNYDVCDNLQRVVHSVADHVSRGAEDETYKRFHDSLPRPNVAIHCGLGLVNDMPPVSCIFGQGDAVDAVRAFIEALVADDTGDTVSRATSFQSIQHDDDLLDDEIDEF